MFRRAYRSGGSSTEALLGETGAQAMPSGRKSLERLYVPDRVEKVCLTSVISRVPNFD
jgi:hypothetical protein